jgi:hypothetical protein
MAYTKYTNFDPEAILIPPDLSLPTIDMGVYGIPDDLNETFLEMVSRPGATTGSTTWKVDTPGFPGLGFLGFKKPVKGRPEWVGDGSTVRPSTGYIYPRKSTV